MREFYYPNSRLVRKRQKHPEGFGITREDANGAWIDLDSPAFRATIKPKRPPARHDGPTRVKVKRVTGAKRTKNRQPFLPGPGSVVRTVLHHIGYQAHWDCGCAAFAEKMNCWGYVGCWRRREEIISWFIKKARDIGVEVNRDRVWSLIWAGLMDLKRRYNCRSGACPLPDRPPDG